MRVRIISGIHGGRFISTPPANSTHPMSERARSAIFNMLGRKVDNALILDVFAGSGSLGLEALSRGAKHATFIEKNRVAAKIINENCHNLNINHDSFDVINTTINNWLETASPDKFDIIFADPPYHDLQIPTINKLMHLLKPDGYMILSHTGRGDLGINAGVVVDNRSYANAHITFYRPS